MPGVETQGFLDFFLDFGEGLEEELGDVGEGDGIAARDASLGEEGEDFSEDVVDVAGGFEVAGERGEFAGDLLIGKAFGAAFFFPFGVIGAEGAMTWGARHSALAADGGEELAASWVGRFW